jgi:hypothetical protein
MEKKIKIGNLYEFYGQLLTDKQCEILDLYCIHDLSFGEIAEELGISRQGVYDTIKRAGKILDEYESKLELLKRFNNREVIINHVMSELDTIGTKSDQFLSADDLKSALEQLRQEIMEMLE